MVPHLSSLSLSLSLVLCSSLLFCRVCDDFGDSFVDGSSCCVCGRSLLCVVVGFLAVNTLEEPSSEESWLAKEDRLRSETHSSVVQVSVVCHHKEHTPHTHLRPPPPPPPHTHGQTLSHAHTPDTHTQTTLCASECSTTGWLGASKQMRRHSVPFTAMVGHTKLKHTRS